MPISATIVIALAPRDDVTLDHVAARPDTALYRAKDKGRETSYLRATRSAVKPMVSIAAG